MTRKTTKYTQADVARALRAVKNVGGFEVVIEPDGKIICRPSTGSAQEIRIEQVEEERVVPL